MSMDMPIKHAKTSVILVKWVKITLAIRVYIISKNDWPDLNPWYTSINQYINFLVHSCNKSKVMSLLNR